MQISDATLPRRERERLMRRQAMLRAAEAVFAERGYTNATLDEIAQRAEFGKGTLYNYFEGGKEEILLAILETLHEDLVEVLRRTFTPEQRGERSFREVFAEFVEACFDFFVQRQDLFMILIKEAHPLLFSADEEKARFFKHQQERMVGALIPMLEDAMARGELRPLPPRSVAHMILGNIKGCQMHLCLRDDRNARGDASTWKPQDAAAFLTTMLLDGLLVRPDARPSPNPTA